MPFPPKGTTKQIPFRHDDEERALLVEVQRVYGECYGLELSLNDVLRHLVRRAGIVVAHTPRESAAQLREHLETCDRCEVDGEKLGCPEGVYLSRTYRRVLRAHTGTGEADDR